MKAYITRIFDYPTMIYVQVPLTYKLHTTKWAISPDESLISSYTYDV